MMNIKLDLSSLYLCLAAITLGTSLFFIFQLNIQNDLFFSGITIDLTLLVPGFLFLFLRQKKLPVTLVSPVLIAMLLLANWVLPGNQKTTLDFILDYIAPVIELTILFVIGLKIYQARKYFKSLDGGDFPRKLEDTIFELLGGKRAAKFAAMELNMFYYLIVKWKKTEGFSYHRNSGVVAMIGTLAFLIIIETTVLHIALQNTLPTLALILFILSAYSFFQIVSLAKSVFLRRVFKKNGQLYLHYGWLHQSTIPIDLIINTEAVNSQEIIGDYIFLGLFKETEEKGILIRTEKNVDVDGLFGKKNQSNQFFIPIDDQNEFIEYLSKDNG